MGRKFALDELAFFVVPRKWIPSIVARFGDDSDVRDAIIHSDEDGGLGFLRWRTPAQTWELSEKGKRWVGARHLNKALRDFPDTRVSESTTREAIVETAAVAFGLPPEKPVSFLCPVCDAKSLGSTKCLACEPPGAPAPEALEPDQCSAGDDREPSPEGDPPS